MFGKTPRLPVGSMFEQVFESDNKIPDTMMRSTSTQVL